MRTTPSRLVAELADVGIVTVDEFVSLSHCQNTTSTVPFNRTARFRIPSRPGI